MWAGTGGHGTGFVFKESGNAEREVPESSDSTNSLHRGIWRGISHSNPGREISSGLANFHEVKHLGFT